MDIVEIVNTLTATPVWLRAGLHNLTEELARQAPNSSEWSPIQILAHVRASDAILAPRVFQLLTRPQAHLAGFDERTWAHIVERARLPLATQLAAFEAQRAELVGVLRTLSPQEWEIAGQHETRGTLTVHMIATDLAEHEREHRTQFETAVAAVRPARHDSETRALPRRSRGVDTGKSGAMARR